MNITLVTTTLYQNVKELRFALFLKTLQNIKNAGYSIVVVDDSPDPAIIQRAKKFGARCFREISHSMGASRRLAFFLAHEMAQETNHKENIYFWLEPEKCDLIRSIPKIVQPLIDATADIVIPARSPSSWKTYPRFQVTSEQKINNAWRKVTGLAGFDPAFGPVAYNDRALPYFIIVDGRTFKVSDHYVQQYAPLIAYFHGLRLASVEIEFTYPHEQRVQEETAAKEIMTKKRDFQLRILTQAYRAIAKQLIPEKGGLLWHKRD